MYEDINSMTRAEIDAEIAHIRQLGSQTTPRSAYRLQALRVARRQIVSAIRGKGRGLWVAG